MIAMKHLTPHTAIWYKTTTGARYSADIIGVNTTMKAWGIVKVHILRHHDHMPLWITRKQVIEVCD